MQNLIENKSKIFSRNAIICIGIIGMLGFIIRIYYTPQDIPLTLDAFRYFYYGIDASILGNMPVKYDFPNTGWSLFLSLVFQIGEFKSSLDYMMIQRICSEIFSVLTIIPLYFLARRFFNGSLAIVGISFFIFSPYIIENSIVGLTDPLFIFLITSFLALFFSNKKRSVIYSFLLLGGSSLIRYESLILIIPALLLFINKYKSDSNFKESCFLVLALFFGVIIPFALWKIQMGMPDGMFSHLMSGAYVVIKDNSVICETCKISIFDPIRGMINLPKYLGVSLLPICFIFVPYSLISILRKENKNFRYLILIGIFILLPAFYGYSRGFEETRYVFVVLPILCIASLFLIQRIILNVKKQNVVILGLVILVIVSSIIYLDYRQPDYEYEKEAIQVAQFVHDLPGKINDYGHESYYVEVIELENVKFPILSSDVGLQSTVLLKGESINEILINAKEQELSYLGITEKDKILSKIFYEENNYPFLKKIFDSDEFSFNFKIKIFEIDYSKIDI